METESQIRDRAEKVARFLEENRAQDVSAIDVAEICGFTDNFVLATTSSRTMTVGLIGQLAEFANEQGWDVPSVGKKKVDDSWLLLDWGSIVIHLFSPEARSFYDLDKLWYQGKIIYSSKSS